MLLPWVSALQWLLLVNAICHSNALTYCLICLDNIVIFLHTAEEHLHLLCIVFDKLREYNLKLKPLRYNFFKEEFKEEITYLAH